jgi:hypothetical protein
LSSPRSIAASGAAAAAGGSGSGVPGFGALTAAGLISTSASVPTAAIAYRTDWTQRARADRLAPPPGGHRLPLRHHRAAAEDPGSGSSRAGSRALAAPRWGERRAAQRRGAAVLQRLGTQGKLTQLGAAGRRAQGAP